MLGLDVTLRTGATAAVLQRMGELGPLGTELLPAGPRAVPVGQRARLAGGSARGVRGGGVPPGGNGRPPRGQARRSMTSARWRGWRSLNCSAWTDRVQVELAGQPAGMTVTDFDVPGEVNGGNARVAMRIDVENFWDVTLGAYARVAAAMGR